MKILAQSSFECIFLIDLYLLEYTLCRIDNLYLYCLILLPARRSRIFAAIPKSEHHEILKMESRGPFHSLLILFLIALVLLCQSVAIASDIVLGKFGRIILK
jgi:hypothetical protein